MMRLLSAVGQRNPRWNCGHEVQALLHRERSERCSHSFHRIPHRVLAEGELHVTRLDLGQIQYVVDEAEQVLAALLNVRERSA